VGQLNGFLEPGSLVLDISEVARISPAGMVAIASLVDKRRAMGRETTFRGIDVCCISSYLTRMDFFKHCGYAIEEQTVRHSADGKFVTLRPITHDVMEMGRDVASCLAPGGQDMDHPLADLWESSFYIFTEMANNVRQHSKGRGFIAAQRTTKDKLLRIAIADNGNGILESFRKAGVDWSESASDAQAILKAFEAKVSSKASPENEGVGLTLVSRLARITDAFLAVISMTGVVLSKPKSEFLDSKTIDGCFPGTLVAMAFNESEMLQFDQKLLQAKVKEGLLKPGGICGVFE
jgi:hypothetical protein